MRNAWPTIITVELWHGYTSRYFMSAFTKVPLLFMMAAHFMMSLLTKWGWSTKTGGLEDAEAAAAEATPADDDELGAAAAPKKRGRPRKPKNMAAPRASRISEWNAYCSR